MSWGHLEIHEVTFPPPWEGLGGATQEDGELQGRLAQTPALWPQRPKELIAPAPRSSAFLGKQLPISKFPE